jgi:hypothetical protein
LRLILMVTVSIGAWMSAAVLDVGRANDDAARTLAAIGLAAAPPTALLADYSGLDERQRRVGLTHAVVNTAALSCYAAVRWADTCPTRKAAAGTGGKLRERSTPPPGAVRQAPVSRQSPPRPIGPEPAVGRLEHHARSSAFVSGDGAAAYA